MCLILIAHRIHPRYPLVVLANRDEFFHRPAQPADWWEEPAGLLAGKDLEAGGTWLGVNKEGRFAALTNYREPNNIKANAPSRGALVTDFLQGSDAPHAYLDTLHERAESYNGFNLLLSEGERLFHYSNRGGAPVEISPGIYGLSNALLDTPWPKVEKGKSRLQQLMNADTIDADSAFSLLQDHEIAQDAALPATGVPLEWERRLSAMFIEIPEHGYGTRCSTFLLVDREGKVTFEERTYVPQSVQKQFAFSWSKQKA